MPPEYVISPPITWACKSWAIYRVEGTEWIPVVYFQKPKNVTSKEFKDFMNRLRVSRIEEK